MKNGGRTSPLEAPTDPNVHSVDCPACLEEEGEPTGDVLVQLVRHVGSRALRTMRGGDSP
jgi:hypothetical protein